MTPLFANEFPDFSPSALKELEDCSEASVYAPGYIQPWGMVLVLQEPHLQIVQISNNAEQWLGISAEALLGQPLHQVFSLSQVNHLAEFLQSGALAHYHSVELDAPMTIPCPDSDVEPADPIKAPLFRATLHRTSDAVILELEPRCPTPNARSSQVYHCLQAAILNFRSATSLTDLAQRIAQGVKAIAGFDRVMIYRFEADEHGVVIAEEKASHLESYLGLHYPATDIPAPARTLFYRNWVRHIPDVYAPPAFLISAPPAPDSFSLDLRQCVLRGVSPYHIEYLQNMGVTASFTLSLIDDQRLWGLIACHHYSPKLVDCETRKTCEFLGQFASIEVVHQQERELNCYRQQVKAIQQKLQQSFLQEPHLIQQVLSYHAPQLLDLVHAQGVAIMLNGHLTIVGQAPSESEIADLVIWLKQHNASHPQEGQVLATYALSQMYPVAQSFQDQASGMLAISILLNHGKQTSYHILWFRPEQIQTVNWAGSPQDAVIVDDAGVMHLCPRKSFTQWQETVRAMSLPWQPAELEAAVELRNTLMLAVLEFSQAALEQAAERAAIANRAKSQFLAKMSHELRTPLNAILGFSQIMHRSPNIPNDFRDHLGIINRSGEHLLTLINDVLEMSKIEAGQLILTESCFNICRLTHLLEEMFALKAQQKNIHLTIEQDTQIPHYLYGDEAKLRQILINLLNNAIKFTQEGWVALRLYCGDSDIRPANDAPVSAVSPASPAMTPATTADLPSITVYVEVQDTGCGIATADLETIFEAFMQTDRGRHIQGTGLGLSISRQFARLMGGDISVSSSPGQGSTFTCQVMLHHPYFLDFVESKPHYHVVGLEPTQPIYRILIAEDGLENRQLLVTLLRSVGFEVNAVETGAEAIAQWQAWQPHLIFMDIQMPVMDGYEAIRQIRLKEQTLISNAEIAGAEGPRPTAPFVPTLPTQIIALTAYAFAEDRVASLAAGCNDHIAKPFTEAVIFESIARHLGVRYRYREEPAQEQPLPMVKPLTRQDLSAMSSEWIAQVHDAAIALRDAKIYHLIAQIPPTQPDLIKTMTYLVDHFQLEVIATLTEI